MNRMTNRVVLCGYNSFNAYGMLRSLGEAGIRSTLIINRCRYPFLAKSRYATNDVFYFDSPSDVPKIIREKIKIAMPKPIIICCDDPIQSVMDCHYDEFKNDYLLSNCKQTQGEITRLMDKDIQIEIARNCGVTVPMTWKIGKSCPIPGNMVYPCIAKPDISIYGSKTQIRVCNNQEELEDALSNRGYLVQEYIDKDYEAIVWGTSVGNGNYFMPVFCKKLRQYPDDNSLSSFGVLESFEQHPNLNKECLNKFLKNLGYTGMFSIEMAVKQGKYYLLEINLRNDGKQYFSTAAGANLPLLYINSLIGVPFVEPKVKTPICFMRETTDFKQIKRKKVSVMKWFGDLFRTKSFFILNLKDPMPFVHSVFGKL